MNNNHLCFAGGFLLGAIFTGIGTWYFMKQKFDKDLEKEVNDIRDSYERRIGRMGDPKVTKLSSAIEKFNGEVKKAADILSNLGYSSESNDPTPYSKYYQALDEKQTPYIIEPSEYGEEEDYATESLTYTLDCVLLDEKDNPVSIEDTIGTAALNHFGDYEDDAVTVRNPETKTDYEVLLDNRYYSSITEEKGGPYPVEIED